MRAETALDTWASVRPSSAATALRGLLALNPTDQDPLMYLQSDSRTATCLPDSPMRDHSETHGRYALVNGGSAALGPSGTPHHPSRASSHRRAR